MRVGVVFPQTELGGDASAVRAYGQRVEELGFTHRGKRVDEQIELMRRLWTEQTLTFDGTLHRVTGAGLAPLPVHRPIPVWIGAMSRPALERAGRLADGWFPPMSPGPELD